MAPVCLFLLTLFSVLHNFSPLSTFCLQTMKMKNSKVKTTLTAVRSEKDEQKTLTKFAALILLSWAQCV